MILLYFALCASSAFPGPASQDASLSDSARLASVEKLYSEKKWGEAAQLAEGRADQPAELDYLRGMSLARLERWREAREAFTSGHRKAPQDTRFLVERAGVAYRTKDFRAAKKDLRETLRRDPKNVYAREFLGTIYLLDRNLEAALKYWNALEKPRLSSVRIESAAHTRRELPERAVTFSAPGVLERDALLATNARLENLEVFPQRRVELAPEEEGSYGAAVHVTERHGWGDSPLGGALSLLTGLPYSTVYPTYFNGRGAAMNFTSLARWDPEKRRVFANFSMPLGGHPERRIELLADARNENWNLSETFFKSGASLTDVNVRRLKTGATIHWVVNGRWSWASGFEVVARRFRNVPATLPAAAKAFFTGSTSLEYWARIEHSLFRFPEQRFTVGSAGETRISRGFAEPLGWFGTIGGELRAHWLPRSRSDDYELQVTLRAAETLGHAPLDQLFELGVERDNDLWLRGHAGTLDGRKGRAPLGRRYALANSEIDKTIYRGAFFAVKLGPFLDTGVVTDPSGLFGSERWLWDTGGQCKIRILGTVTVQLLYGRDLRDGRNDFFGIARP